MFILSRRSWPSAITLGILTFVAAAYYSGGIASQPDPWRQGLTVRLTETAFVVNLLSAIFGAWCGGVYARATMHIRRSRRMPLRVIAASLWPQWLLAVTAVFLADSLQLRDWGVSPPVPDLLVLLPSFAAAIGCSILGWAIAAAMGNALAIAVAALVSYALSATPLLFSKDAFLSLSGEYPFCCSLITEPDPRIFGMSLLSATAFSLTAVGLLRLGLTRVATFGLAGLTFLCAVGLGASLPALRTWSYRETTMRCQTAPLSGITVCLWPEHETLLNGGLQAVDDAITAWQQELAFTPAFTTITEQVMENDPPNGNLAVHLRQSDTEPEIISRLASSIVPNRDVCAGPLVTGELVMNDWLPYMLARSAGVSPEIAATQLMASDQAAAEDAWLAFMSRPVSARHQELQAGLAAMSPCTTTS